MPADASPESIAIAPTDRRGTRRHVRTSHGRCRSGSRRRCRARCPSSVRWRRSATAGGSAPPPVGVAGQFLLDRSCRPLNPSKPTLLASRTTVAAPAPAHPARSATVPNATSCGSARITSAIRRSDGVRLPRSPVIRSATSTTASSGTDGSGKLFQVDSGRRKSSRRHLGRKGATGMAASIVEVCSVAPRAGSALKVLLDACDST